MFIVFNRAKISSYLISLGTVVTLFAMAFVITDNKTKPLSANVYENNYVNSEENSINSKKI